MVVVLLSALLIASAQSSPLLSSTADTAYDLHGLDVTSQWEISNLQQLDSLENQVASSGNSGPRWRRATADDVAISTPLNTPNSNQLGATQTSQQQPTLNYPNPSPNVAQPTLNYPQPVNSNPQPTSTISQPTQVSVQPTQNYPQPTLNTQSTQNYPQSIQNYQPPSQNMPQSTQNFPQSVQNMPQPTQNYLQPTQSYLQPTQSIPPLTQNIPQPTQNYQQPTQNIPQPTQNTPHPPSVNPITAANAGLDFADQLAVLTDRINRRFAYRLDRLQGGVNTLVDNKVTAISDLIKSVIATGGKFPTTGVQLALEPFRFPINVFG